MGSSDGRRDSAPTRSRPVMLATPARGLQSFARIGERDWLALLAEAGLDRDKLDDEEARIPLEAGLRLFEAAARLCDRPSLGAEYGAHFAIGGTGAPGFAVVNARTVRIAMRSIVRFMPLISSMKLVRCDEDANCGTIVWSFPVGHNVPTLQYAAWGVAAVARRLAIAMPKGWTPLAVEFDADAPVRTDGFQRVFGPRVAFGCKSNRLVIAADELDRPLPQANEQLYRLMTKLASIEQRHRGAFGPVFESEIRTRMAELIKEGRTRLDDLAEDRGQTPSQLRRELREHQLDFKQLLGDVRKAAAQSYLEETDLPITEISFALGYSDCSVFTRACHKWFGKSPREVRSDCA